MTYNVYENFLKSTSLEKSPSMQVSVAAPPDEETINNIIENQDKIAEMKAERHNAVLTAAAESKKHTELLTEQVAELKAQNAELERQAAESRRSAKRSHRISIISLVVAVISLITSVLIGVFV